VKSFYSAVRTECLYKSGLMALVKSFYSAVRTECLYKAGF
jgi:hypothetical protein